MKITMLVVVRIGERLGYAHLKRNIPFPTRGRNGVVQVRERFTVLSSSQAPLTYTPRTQPGIPRCMAGSASRTNFESGAGKGRYA